MNKKESRQLQIIEHIKNSSESSNLDITSSLETMVDRKTLQRDLDELQKSY